VPGTRSASSRRTPAPKPKAKAKTVSATTAATTGSLTKAKVGTSVAPLSERAIIDAALELLAERGVDGLTMRELSNRLGVALGATYRHVRSKHDLLRLMAKELYARIEPESRRSDGFAQARSVMVQLHDLLGAYPGMAIYMGQHMSDFASAPLGKLVSDPLVASGLREVDAVQVQIALTLFTAGHLLVRGSLPDWPEKDDRAVFLDGLDLLLDGARGRVGRRMPRPRATRERR
jgi:TetR/AcrR family transcriptional regulator, tetracycline repressor protein